jgi:C4-dicarboxylate-specific signal transduction histidine kinase
MHDVLGGLAIWNAYAELVSKSLAAGKYDRASEYSAIAAREAQRVTASFKFVHDAVRPYYSSDSLEREPDRLYRVLQQVVETSGREEPSTQLDVAASLTLVGLSLPSGPFEVVIRELIENARKANRGTPRTLAIKVGFGFFPDNGLLEIRCADDGCGFTAEQLADPDHLFRGRGVPLHGLSFVWNMATRLGGSVLLSNAPAGGAMLRVLMQPVVLPGWERR